MRALEEAGFIKGYRALLDEKLLGYEINVFAMVHLASQAEPDLLAFENFVKARPLVRECWMLSGEIDFILKCVAPDLRRFQEFIAELTAAPNVRNVKTSLVLKVSKDAAIVPGCRRPSNHRAYWVPRMRWARQGRSFTATRSSSPHRPWHRRG